MNNHLNKNTETLQLVAGILPTDSNIEFAGVSETKQVIFLQNGTCKYFSELPDKYKCLVKTRYIEDTKAFEFLNSITPDIERQVELYTYYLYGDLDTTPDIENGVLQEPENFRDCEKCPSLLWNKDLTINGKALDAREIMITDMFGKDMPDKAIAAALNLSHPYLNQLKGKLFKKVGVTTKTAYVALAIKEKVIRN